MTIIATTSIAPWVITVSNLPNGIAPRWIGAASIFSSQAFSLMWRTLLGLRYVFPEFAAVAHFRRVSLLEL